MKHRENYTHLESVLWFGAGKEKLPKLLQSHKVKSSLHGDKYSRTIILRGSSLRTSLSNKSIYTEA